MDEFKTRLCFVICTCFLFCLLIVAAPAATAQSANAQADDTLIVLTAPGADMDQVKSILNEVHGTVIKVTTVKKGGYQILRIRPETGKQSDTERKILAKHDKNIRAVERNTIARVQWDWWDFCTPNDPDFPAQWGLTDMNFTGALCLARPWFRNPITFIDSGVTPVPCNFELSLIKQYNFVGGANAVAEAPFDSGTHGTAMAGIAAARTDDHQFIAGIASGFLPVPITMCRVSSDGSSIATADVFDALAWCIDNQAARGGPGPINVSLGTPPPLTFNSSSLMQTLAQTLQSQGDLMVNAAGNTGTQDSTPEQFIRRVAATDQNDQQASFSVFGPFHAAAPGVSILSFNGSNSVAFGSGTSDSCAFWSGAIAYLQGIRPGLTAPQADAILYNSANVTTQGYHIPNLRRAVLLLLFHTLGDGDGDWDD